MLVLKKKSSSTEIHQKKTTNHPIPLSRNNQRLHLVNSISGHFQTYIQRGFCEDK